MHTSSYLEAFLSVYGWMMYNTLYELFAMTWLLFLPFMKLGFFTFIDTLSDSANRYGQFKKGIITFVLMLFALFLAVVPLDTITVQGATIDAICSKTEIKNKTDYENLKNHYRFDVAEGGKVPLLPSLVMRVAAGTNGVIYTALPCAVDVNKFATVMQMAEVTKPELAQSVSRFNNECAIPARNRIIALQNKAPKTYGKMLEQFKKDDKYSDMKEESFVNGKLYRMAMAPDMGQIGGLIDAEEQNVVKEILENGTGKGAPLYSADRVTEVASDNPDNSQLQKAANSGPASCLEWWDKQLFPELKKNVSDDVAFKLSRTTGYNDKDCINYSNLQYGSSLGNRDVILVESREKGVLNKDKCIAQAKGAYGEKFEDDLVYYATNNINAATKLALNREDRDSASTIGTLGIVGALLSVFTSKADVLGAIADNAVNFYAQMFFFRVLLQMLQPMLLMGIFAFWGIYLIIADYRWETILKGLILIFIISLLPSLWAITQYLDNALWQALYPDIDSLELAAKRQSGNYVERLLLDAASTVFNIIFPLILMHLVNEAGGGRPGSAFAAVNNGAEQVGNTGGRMASGATGGAVGMAGRGAGKGMDKFRQWRANRKDQSSLPPGGSRY